MTKRLFAGLIGLLLLAGCAHNYVVTLNNGTRVNAASKPRREGANFRFQTTGGQEVLIPAVRVREIAPASMAQQETFTPVPSK